MSAPAFTVITTFAGCGGSSLGYRLAGGKVRLAAEWDAHAVQVYRANFPTTPIFHGDVAELSVGAALEMAGLRPGELDVFDGSPPCQGFSTVGARRLDDERNGLFREYVRLLRGLRPRVLVMENVSGMVKGKMRLVFAQVMKELRAAGYRVACRLLDAQYFGVPQARQRVIFIGVREDLGLEPSHPRAQLAPIPVRTVLSPPPPGLRLVGVKNPDFENGWRPVTKPCCTIVKSRPPVLLLSDGSQRDMTPTECARVGSFPEDFHWLGNAKQVVNRIGNSVPPLLMRAVATHIRDVLLPHCRAVETASRQEGIPA